MSLPHRHRTVARLVATASVALGGLCCAGPAIAASRQAIPGTHPFWAVGSHRKAAAASNGAVNVRVYLASQDPRGSRPTRSPSRIRAMVHTKTS